MKCPLLQAGLISSPEISLGDSSDCLGEHCAWWDEDHKRCSVWAIARASQFIMENLRDIRQELPGIARRV